MDPSTDTPEWTKARLSGQQKTISSRQPENLFCGRADFSKTSTGNVEITRISVAVHKNEFAPLSFAVGDELTWLQCNESPLPYGLSWIQALPARFEFDFDLPATAACFGLGERYSPLNLRGAVHTLCSTDETKHNESADALYKAIPFLIIEDQRKHTSFFLDSPAPQIWDLDSARCNKGSIGLLSRRGWQLYVLQGGSLPDIVEAYTQLTGRSALPPLWSLGHQQSRWSYPDEQTAWNIAANFRAAKIPCDTLVLDIDYMDEYRVFTHSPKRFANFKKLADKLHDNKFKLVTIVDPGIKVDPNYPIYNEAISQDLVCLAPDGEPFTEKVWPGVCVFPDFLKEETRSWWGKHLKFYTDNGVDGIWNDMNEPAFFQEKKPLPAGIQELPPDDEQRFYQMAPEGPVGHLEVRNLYGLLMSRATHEGLSQLRPNQRPFVLTRSAYAGIQKYAAVWLGDNMSWFEHLRKSIPMLVNMGLSGVPFAGVDIGGFAGDTSAELLIRWYEVGIFYPFFRNHCAMKERAQEPWAFCPATEHAISKLIAARYRLLPYIYSLFWEHSRTGAPLMRPLSWHYPSDSIATNTGDQFMLGRDILVAPITERAQHQRFVYLPAGWWHPFSGGAPLEGERVHLVQMPAGSIPAFVRDGAVLPLYDLVQSTADLKGTPVTFQTFGENGQGTYFEDDGLSNDYRGGKYNEWHIVNSGGMVEAKAIHHGYDQALHEFFSEHAGIRKKIAR